MKKLPKMFMGLLKTKAFMERDVYPDVRIAEWARMISMSPEHHEALYCPYASIIIIQTMSIYIFNQWFKILIVTVRYNLQTR